MSKRITTLFWDVGGVLLTNGWDAPARRRACEHFGIEQAQFEERHELVSAAFETGRMRLEEYLRRTVFERPRRFGEAEFRNFMFSCSQPQPDSLALASRLSRSQRYLMATVNNESLELNLHRIRTYGLREVFAAFFSSCFLGTKKPEYQIFWMALQITQRAPEECLFIDDRTANLDCARELGLATVKFESATQLAGELSRQGITAGD